VIGHILVRPLPDLLGIAHTLGHPTAGLVITEPELRPWDIKLALQPCFDEPTRPDYPTEAITKLKKEMEL